MERACRLGATRRSLVSSALMFRRCFIGACMAAFFVSSAYGQARDSLLQIVADNPAWTAIDSPVTYDATNVAELVPELASSLQVYGLRGAAVQDWQGAQGRMRIVLYELIDDLSAYGFFTIVRASRTPVNDSAVGAEGFTAGNSLYFWQSRYVVQIDANLAAADAVGRTLSEHIFGQTQKPPVSAFLPPANLIASSDRYILSPENIDGYFDLDPANLGFEDSVEAATADYRINGQVTPLLLLLYPTQQLARKYAEQLQEAAASAGAALHWKRAGSLLAIVPGAAMDGDARFILDQVHYESSVNWQEGPPVLTVPTLLLTIFSFIGLAVLFIAVAGIGFGGFRVLIKSRYPDRVFDRTEAMQIIQLNISQGLTRESLVDENAEKPSGELNPTI